MSGAGDRMPDLDDVERFYARQRGEILARLEGTRAHHGPRRPLARELRTTWLAAAAVVAFAALGLALLPGPPGGDLAPPLLADDMTEVEPLAAFSAWDETALAEAALQEGPEIGTLTWLLEGESHAAADSLPGFLEPFGSWPEGVNGESPDAGST